MAFPVLTFLTFRLYLQNTDRLVDRLGPVDSVLFTLATGKFEFKC